MMGSSAPKGIARFLLEASPALRCKFKSVTNKSVLRAPLFSYSTAPGNDERRNSDRFWKLFVLVGGVALCCRVGKMFMDKHASITEASLENEILEAKLKEKNEELKKLEMEFQAGGK
ncbi:hypothetical protein ACP70R_037872 [Stipagrostis hirtigluma subsp. patula]